MNVWETTLVNLQKGYDKLALFAAAFSERVKAEINIVRLRMQINEVQTAVREEQLNIGRKLTEMREDGSLPETMERFLGLDEIASSLEKLALHGKTLDNLIDDLDNEAGALKHRPQKKDEEKKA
jgi:hypothetical protein